ncbi:glycosyl transferase family 1 [Tistrella bauzanensis]|uniref:Glycosyl transferase family 1 n=1 Tax=Tistrella bauzanensis TaxID=657419 RepID=A0ABQ1IUV9_9PROT|nr:glycosyltransferase family 4 protein [Tistrella bauzanensis]GGB52684.1 glycosyl transferase family 1 [Tistrella bauzanensis]
MTDLLLVVPGPVDLATGGYVYDRRIMAALAALGHEVETLALPAGQDARAEAIHARLHADNAPAVGAMLIDGLALPGLAPLLADLRRHARCPRLLALVHHPMALETGLTADRATDLERQERAALALVDGVVATSPATAALLTDGGWTRHPVVVIEPGLSVEPAMPAVPGDDGGADDGGNAGEIRLLCVASLTPRKAHQDLVAALSDLGGAPGGSTWRLDLVGPDTLDPDHAGRVRAAIDAAGLGDRIRCHGVLSGAALARCYAAADVFVLPSRFEGYGMAFAEAMAAGLPVVGCVAGAVPDLVPASAGILVPPGDVPALAHALGRLIADADLRRQLAAGAAVAGAALPRWPDQARRLAALAGLSEAGLSEEDRS